MRNIYLAICMLLSITAVGQAPFNDNCIEADTLIDLSNNCDFRPYQGATFDFMGPECGPDSMDNIWFTFKAQGTALEVETQLFDGRDVFIQVFEFIGTPCDSNSAVLLACDTNQLVKGQFLQLDEQYYISVSAIDGVPSQMIVCVSNPLINQDPINDNLCNAIGLPIDSTCRLGTLENATFDFPNPSCPIADERSVWYRGTLPPNANAMKIALEPLGLDTMTYEVGLYRLENGTNCVEPPTFIAGMCSQGKDTLTVYGLEPGNKYHVMVSSEQSNNHTFSICLIPIIPPPGCALNDLCSTAELLPLDADEPLRCYEGCNTGASVGPIDTTSICTQFSKPTVYYKVYVDSTMDEIELRMNGMDLEKPQLAVYYGNCNELNFVICDFGSDGLLNFTFEPPVKDTTYYILASDILGRTGEFELCLDATTRQFQCNYDNALEVIATSLGSPLNGPYKAGEELYFRYTLEDWIPTECNWLQGIVPVFISGFDPTSFEADGEIKAIYSNPEAKGEGSWNWYSSGDVHYNYNNPIKGYDEGDIISPGWFFLEEGKTNLDSSRGDGINCSDSLDLEWTVEFSVRIVPYPGCIEDTMFNALIEFKTFSDGEIGNNVRPACSEDLSTIFSVPFECCAGPILNGRSDTTCSGNTINYSLSRPDSIDKYKWTVLPNFYVDGESNTVGPQLTQTLVNNSNVPQLVEYTLYARDTSGCYGPPAHYNVTVLPKLRVNAGPDTIKLCRDQRFTLGSAPTASGGTPPYKYFWSDPDLMGPNPDLIVGNDAEITLEVRDSFRCVNRDTVNLFTSLSPKAVLPDTINVCRGDSVTVGIPLEGTPPFTYNVSFNGNYAGRDTTVVNYISYNLMPVQNITINIDSLKDAICRSEVDNSVELVVRDSVTEIVNSTICGDEVYFIGNQGFSETGNYEVTLPDSDQYGCDSTVVLNLTVNELIILSDTIIEYNETADTGYIETDISGGVPPYEFSWNTGDTSHFLRNVSSGIYKLTVTDDVGCMREFTFALGDVTSVDNAFNNEYNLFPQPLQAGQEITLKLIDFTSGNYSLNIYNVHGEIVKEEEIYINSANEGHRWIMKNKGMYFWKIQQDGKTILYGKCIVIE